MASTLSRGMKFRPAPSWKNPGVKTIESLRRAASRCEELGGGQRREELDGQPVREGLGLDAQAGLGPGGPIRQRR